MGEFLKSECPHCSQSIEYPEEGNGETVSCPTCDEPFVLTPIKPPTIKVSPPSSVPHAPTVRALTPENPPKPVVTVQLTAQNGEGQVAPATTPATTASKGQASSRATLPSQRSGPPVIATAVTPAATTPKSKPPALAPLDRAFAEVEDDPAFATRKPTREQVARAWALASFSREDASKPPTHAELVAALKKLFREFKDPKAAVNGMNANKTGH